MQAYSSYQEYLKKKFSGRVDRITLNAGFTCPNIDGKKAVGGCTFCQDASYTGLSLKDNADFRSKIREQIQVAKKYLSERYASKQYLAYFQNGTNTYAKADDLEQIWNEALQDSQIKGLILSTRPDCFSEEIYELLEKINQRSYLEIELGMPSHLDQVNHSLNRAHTVDDFIQATHQLAKRNINICAHVILGLPGEASKDLVDKARFFSDSPISAIKIHNLVVFKHTQLARDYLQGKYQTLSLEQYTQDCVNFLEHLRQDILVQRVNAHGPRRLTLAPEWSINKWLAINAVNEEFKKRGTYQGYALESRDAIKCVR